MTATHDDDKGQKGQAKSGSDPAAKKRRPETIADFMALDSVIGAVSSGDDPLRGTYRVSSSEHGEQFADMLWEAYERDQEEAKRRKEEGAK